MSALKVLIFCFSVLSFLMFMSKTLLAQSSGMTQMKAGTVWTGNDGTSFTIVSMNVKAGGDKCTSSSKHKINSGRNEGAVISLLSSFDAAKQADGILCSNGQIEMKDQSGKLIYSGKSSYNYLYKKGAWLRIDR